MRGVGADCKPPPPPVPLAVAVAGVLPATAGHIAPSRTLQTLLKDYMSKKRHGTLLLDKYDARMSKCMRPAPLLCQDAEGGVSFGDVCMIKHGASGAALAFDVDDKVRAMRGLREADTLAAWSARLTQNSCRCSVPPSVAAAS